MGCHLFNPINLGSGECWHTIGQERGIATLQVNAQSPPEVSHNLSLLLTGVARQCSPQFPHLPLCSTVPPPEGLCCHWDEGYPLPAAVFLSPSDFAVMCKGEGKARGCGSLWHGGLLDWMDHCDI